MAPKVGLKDLAIKLYTDGPVKMLHTPKRIRILQNGAYIADTTEASYVWEHPYYPQYYLPKSSFHNCDIKAGEDIHSEDGKHIATLWNISVGDKSTDQVICFADNLGGKAEALSGLVKASFADFDQWLEEDTPIFVHPKDPYKRIDIIASVRPMKVHIDGHAVASTTTSMHLFETDLPTRYYMPLTSVDMSLLRPSKTKTHCPYKGEAEYYHIVVGGKEYNDILWFYNHPTHESMSVAGLCCFYNEKVDIDIMEDGKWRRLERPKTQFV